MSNSFNMDISNFYMDISRLLNIEPNVTLKCIGTTSKNKKCPNQISATNRAWAITTLHSLELLESVDELWNLLHLISSRLLCYHHWDQQYILREQWWMTFLALSSSRDPWAEFRMPGGFPEEDQNLLAAISELSSLEVDKFFEWRDKQAKLAEAERAEATRAKRAARRIARGEAANKRDCKRIMLLRGKKVDHLFRQIWAYSEKAERRKSKQQMYS